MLAPYRRLVFVVFMPLLGSSSLFSFYRKFYDLQVIGPEKAPHMPSRPKTASPLGRFLLFLLAIPVLTLAACLLPLTLLGRLLVVFRVYQVLAQGDLFLNSSVSEGLPLAIIEASRAGLVVVATDVGGKDRLLMNMSPCSQC